MLKLIEIYVIKKNLNIIKKQYKKIIAFIIILALPLIMMKISSNNQSIIQLEKTQHFYNNLYMLVVLIFLIKNILRGKLVYKKEILDFYTLVPSSYKKIIAISLIDEFITYFILFSVFTIIGLPFQNIDMSVLAENVISIAYLSIFLTLANFIILGIAKRKNMRIAISIILALLSVAVILDMIGKDVSIAFNILSLDIFIKFFNLGFSRLIISVPLLFIITAIMLKRQKNNLHTNIDAAKRILRFQFHEVHRILFRFNPKKRLIISKEIVQILNEYSFLTSIMLNTFLIVFVMIILGINTDIRVIYLGEIILFSHPGFVLGLTSLARESGSKWILHTSCPKWKCISNSKFIACLIVSIILSLLSLIIFLFANILMFKGNEIDVIKIYLLSIVFIQPLSVGMGMLFSTKIPYEKKNQGVKTTYTFRGYDSILIIFEIWTIVMAMFIIYFSKIQNTFLIFYIIYNVIIYYISQKKLSYVLGSIE